MTNFEEVAQDAQKRDNGFKSVNFLDDEIVFIEDLRELLNSDIYKSDSILLIRCTDGILQICINSKTNTLHPDEILFCVPNVIINNSMATPQFKGKALCISTKLLAGMFQISSDLIEKSLYIRDNPILKPGDEDKELIKLYYQLISMLLKRPSNPYHKECIISLIRSSFYGFMARMSGHASPVEAPVGLQQGNILFSKFTHLLSSEKGKKLSVGYYADRLNVTSKYLSKVCKQVSGKSCIQWINAQVLNEIIHSLVYTNKTIKEISQDLEFANISFFGKFVKKHLGVSPKEYRRLHTK